MSTLLLFSAVAARASRGALHGDLVRRDESPEPRVDVDLVLLHEVFDALGAPEDDLVAELHDAWKVELDAGGPHSEIGGMVLRFVVQRGRLEHRFRGDAAAVQAGAAETDVRDLRVLLDDRGPEAELGGPDGGDVAPRSRADHDQVVHSSLLSVRPARVRGGGRRSERNYRGSRSAKEDAEEPAREDQPDRVDPDRRESRDARSKQRPVG